MNAYVSAKFAGEDNREIVEGLCSAAERAGFAVVCTIRDFDDFGTDQHTGTKLTDFIFDSIERADVLLIDATDKGVGLGIEAGFAAANEKPLVILLAENADPSPTLAELATHVVNYHGFRDLTDQLTALRAKL